MKFETKTRTMFSNDAYDYICSYSNLDETASWSERYNNGLDLVRCEIEDIDGIDTEAEDYVPMTEEQILSRVYSWIDSEWDDLEFSLSHLDWRKDGQCVIFGSIGRWNGRSHGFNFANGIYEAVRWCANGVDGLTIKQVNGHIEIDGIHHDGSNHYEIHLLNERGEKLRERLEWGEDVRGDITDRHYHKAMPLYLECA